MDTLKASQLKNLLLYTCEQIQEAKEYLTRIDSDIGDGDHGISMSIGFKKAHQVLNQKEYKTVNELFQTIGMSLLNSMGGASGVIFGTMFFAGIKGKPEMDKIDIHALSEVFADALEAIKKRGNASVGDKTVVDALDPAIRALRHSALAGESIRIGLRRAAQAAEEGMESTRQLVAKFGKAKTLGERAIGYQDPGATSVYLIFKAMSEWMEQNQEEL